jgi:hypothetical protein
MKTGTDSIGAICASPPPTMCAARMTKLPVMWAVNSPSRTRKPMMSVHPAVTLSTISSAWTARELSTGGVGTHPIGPSASTDTVPDGVVTFVSFTCQ